MSSEEYDVVINDEDQYSIWRVGQDIPAGWRAAGFRGPREACLGHIDAVWTDLRQRSLREHYGAGQVGQP